MDIDRHFRALILSQLAISFSWADAGYGTLPNIILLAGLVFGFLSSGPRSFRAEYNREVAQDLARSVPTQLLTEADLVHLPAVVQRYIRRSGAVGLPKVQSFSARYHGQIRSGPDSSWMSFTGRQHNAYDRPSRLFLMDATKSGVPFQAFHRFVGPSATMRVKVASMFTLVNAAGPEMDEAETVTLFNDLCVLAPGALITGSIRWREIDDRSVEASFTNAGRTIRAVLSFNDLGELTNFLDCLPELRSAPAHGFRRGDLARTGRELLLPALCPGFDRVQRGQTAPIVRLAPCVGSAHGYRRARTNN